MWRARDRRATSSAATGFTALALMGQLTGSLSTIPGIVTGFFRSLVSLRRVEHYLSLTDTVGKPPATLPRSAAAVL